MTAFDSDIGPISLKEERVEIGWLIETDDGTPYEYEGVTLRMEIGRERGTGDPLTDLSTDDEDMEWRTDDDGNVYPVAIFTSEKLADLTPGKFPYDIYAAGGGGETGIDAFDTRIFRGTITFEAGVIE